MKKRFNFKEHSTPMALYLINGEKHLVHFTGEGSSFPAYPALPGGQVKLFQNEQVQLLIKEISTEFFSIRYKLFHFEAPLKIETVGNASGIHSKVMLENEVDFFIEPLGPVHQKEGTVSLLLGPLRCYSGRGEAGRQYRALDIFAPEQMAVQLARFFPQLPVPGGRVRNLFPFPHFIAPSLNRVIDDILDCPFDAFTSAFYFDVKVREYFYLLLQQCPAALEPKYHFTPYEVERLVLARELLLADLGKPPLSVRELARQTGLSEFKLKAGFTHFFQAGIFECFQQARMYHARQLLLQTNKPIKEICTLAGYPRMTNFITAFRRFFNCTPGSLRR